jgi:hypothetical protein
MNKEALIKNPENIRPHVVLLGAGASRAAFPNGESTNKLLPLMNDLAETLELATIVNDAGLDPSQNFESIYSSIKDKPLRNTLEKEIKKYFSALTLPATATDYDRLLLSLRGKDAIFTFNWDPFLFDACVRNHHVAKLPEIFFLHGNVRIGSCIQHQKWGGKSDICPTCGVRFSEVPLLYPIEKKDYSENANEYVKEAWKNAEYFFKNAFTVTIFGYGAPSSDTEAVKLLHNAWFDGSTRKLEHIEIIDIADSNTLHERWVSFTPTNHYQIRSNLSESRLLQWPRRSCESLLYPMRDGEACEAFPLTLTDNLEELHEAVREIAHYENCIAKKYD